MAKEKQVSFRYHIQPLNSSMYFKGDIVVGIACRLVKLYLSQQERPAKKSRRAVAEVVVEVAKKEEKDATPLPPPPCFMEDGLLTCPICLDLLYNAMK